MSNVIGYIVSFGSSSGLQTVTAASKKSACLCAYALEACAEEYLKVTEIYNHDGETKTQAVDWRECIDREGKYAEPYFTV